MLEIKAPEALVTLPPPRSRTASTPEIEPVLLTTPLPVSDIPLPPDEEIFPALLIVQVVPVPPSMPSAPEPVEVTEPAVVMDKGLPAALRTTGPAVLLLIVLPSVGTLMVKLSALEGAELGPPAAAWVAVTEWLALASGVVGV